MLCILFFYGDTMNENDILISHALDLKERAAESSVITTTSFLSLEEASSLMRIEKINNKFVDTFYYGGYDEAERKVAVFVPSFMEYNSEEPESLFDEFGQNPLAVLEIKKDRFATLTHRDYLGALMGLGIKRETVGDIIITDDGCYLICLASISGFICDNLKQAGRGQLKVSISDFSKLEQGCCKTEIYFCSVASLRLDCIVAAAFKMSRSDADINVNQGLVYVNGSQIFKCDYFLKEKDKIVLRGKGKVVLDEIIGESKKGRLHLNLKKYI